MDTRSVGRVRNTVKANVAAAQSSAADLANVQLTAQAEVAVDYFELRIRTDSLRSVPRRSRRMRNRWR